MRFSLDERGQGLTEYAFIISLVVIVVIVILYFFGVTVQDMYEYFVPILVDVFT
jgi:Flp pilus assembly pilin Flp